VELQALVISCAVVSLDSEAAQHQDSNCKMRDHMTRTSER